MKRISLSLLLLTAIANVSMAQIALGPEAGINLSNYTGESQGQSVSTSARLGVRVGGIADIGISSHLYMQPGIFYVMNGYKSSDLTDDVHSASIPGR